MVECQKKVIPAHFLKGKAQYVGNVKLFEVALDRIVIHRELLVTCHRGY